MLHHWPARQRRAVQCRIILMLLVCVSSAACRSQPVATGPATLLGVFFGNQGWAMAQVRNMETWQAKKLAVLNMYTNWCDRAAPMDNLFGQQLPNIWNNRNVPLITWEPFLCSPAETPADVEVRAAAGQYDGYFSAWADRLKAFLSGPDHRYNTGDDRRAYVRVGHEMNGNWYPWSAEVGGNAPSDFVAMWKRLKGIFDGKGLDRAHLQWIWCVNDADVGNFHLEQYFPGDSSVDWVAIDGFNWGTSQSWSSWQSAADSYSGALARLRALTSKPLALTELASSTSVSGGSGVAAKSRWIAEAYAYVTAKDIRMVAWFNEDKETDWAIFGGSNSDATVAIEDTSYKVYSAYKAAVGQARFVPADGGNQRLLTDAQFAGQ